MATLVKPVTHSCVMRIQCFFSGPLSLWKNTSVNRPLTKRFANFENVTKWTLTDPLTKRSLPHFNVFARFLYMPRAAAVKC